MIMVAMSYFCRQKVSQISLKIVANCSHPSEILALPKRFMILSLNLEIIVYIVNIFLLNKTIRCIFV